MLEPVCKIGKEENGSDGDHGREIGSSFFIASSNATKLFETIDEPFHDIPFSVVLFVEEASTSFVAAPSDGTANMVALEIVAKGSTGVAFVCHQTLWTETALS